MSSRNTDPHQAGAAANSWLVVILVILMALLLFRTINETVSDRPDYTPRIVTPRGDLASGEKVQIEIFEKTSPSVVYIRSKGTQPERFNTSQIQTQELASGTGFVWDESGHVITNLHVVKDAVLTQGTQLEVQLVDGTVHDAEFIGAVYQHDIAVLRIRARAGQLLPIAIGSSEELKVGQNVFAIGNPFGFDRTMSTGIIGGLNRSVATDGQNNEFLDGLIQTDAAINPGNSGGPLLDSAGRLIGVNTAIVSTSGASAGLGFAVPVRDVMKSVSEVLTVAGSSQSAALGIGILNEEFAVSHGIPDEIFRRGPIIRNVYANTAAADAGLRGTSLSRRGIELGDQIIGIDGKPVTSGEELRKMIMSRNPGDQVVLDILRGESAGKVTVTLKAPKLLL
jgi:S1-C subfamily serine protease